MKMPKIIAHRGASAHAPENTLAAFALALEHKADGIELDVMLTADEQVVVIHDDTVDRTTDGTGLVREMTLAQLEELTAGEGEKIPTLTEVLDQFGGKFLINIELKNYSSIFDALPIKVADLVLAHDLVDSVLISSFNPFNMRRFCKKAPKSVIGLLTTEGKADLWLWSLFRYDCLHPYFTDVDSALVTKMHARQKQVNVWTVDDPKEILRLASLNVDSIITNDPLSTRKILEGAG